MLVSVVIPVRDRPVAVLEAVASVAQQTYGVTEVVVVDDGSDPPLPPSLFEDSSVPVKVLRHDQPRGASAARNLGLALATGDAILFLDSDDRWLPGHVSAVAASLRAVQSHPVVVATGFVVRGPRRPRRVRLFLPPGREYTSLLCLAHGSLTCSALSMTKAARLDGVAFDEGCIALQDLDLCLQAAERGILLPLDSLEVEKTVQAVRLYTPERGGAARTYLQSKWIAGQRGLRGTFARMNWAVRGALEAAHAAKPATERPLAASWLVAVRLRVLQAVARASRTTSRVLIRGRIL